MIRRSAIALALVLTTTAAVAQSRGRAISPSPISGNTVAGTVTAVNGHLIALAGGLVSIDSSHAQVTGTVKVGSLIFAILSSGNVGPNEPLPATTIAVTEVPDVTLSGPVQAIEGQTLTLLGRTIAVDSNTSFGGGHAVHGLTDIAVNDTVAVEANVTNGSLIATRILVFAPIAHMPLLIHGTVKSIGTSSWVITDSHGKDVTVTIDARTKIIGSPKVGDPVDVLANVDSANNYVAISIIAVSPPQMRLSGVVKSIGPTTWVVGPAVGLGPDFLLQVNAQTRIVGNPQVGDHVDVVAQVTTTGLVAISITKT